MKIPWDTWPDRGFLANPDPLTDLTAVDSPFDPADLDAIEVAARHLPAMLHAGNARGALEALPALNFPLADLYAAGMPVTERLALLYGLLANAYVYAVPDDIARHLPKNLAVPLVQIAAATGRPPILAYASYVLNNWMRIDPSTGHVIDNLTALNTFTGTTDETWFILSHAAIEADAAGTLQGIQVACDAARQSDLDLLESALGLIAAGLTRMTETFRRMPECCDPQTYYDVVRPYLFGFNDLVYDGVEAFNGQPQTFRGQSGAQSAVIPALVGGLGLEHEQSGLMQHLAVMREYMPPQQRDFIARMEADQSVRPLIIAQKPGAPIREAYNEALRRVLEFRRLHFHFATAYIFARSKHAVGTGGTDFMTWLAHLTEETEAHML